MTISSSKSINLHTLTDPKRIGEFTVMPAASSTTINRGILSLNTRRECSQRGAIRNVSAPPLQTRSLCARESAGGVECAAGRGWVRARSYSKGTMRRPIHRPVARSDSVAIQGERAKIECALAMRSNLTDASSAQHRKGWRRPSLQSGLEERLLPRTNRPIGRLAKS